MNCQEVQPFVSALHDGESVPKEAAEHIGGCSTCKERLREYAEMGAELRLLASAGAEEIPAGLPALPPRVRRWRHLLTARVLVPRFALGLGVLLIAALSLGLSLMRAQSAGLWFQFDVSSADGGGKWGSLLQAGDPPARGYLSVDSQARMAFQIKALEVHDDVVRLWVRARAFNPESLNLDPKQVLQPSLAWPDTTMERILADTRPQEFSYVPGQTLEIPVEGGGKILVKGQVFHLRPSFSADSFPVSPGADQIVLTKAGLVRGNEFLGEIEGAGSVRAADPAIAIYVPQQGVFVFTLKPQEGAVEGVTEFGRAQFKFDGQQYILFSATPITGGQQPREFWVYRDPDCHRWCSVRIPVFIGGGTVSNVLEFVRK
jgi:hypothetical protein